MDREKFTAEKRELEFTQSKEAREGTLRKLSGLPASAVNYFISQGF